MLIEIVWLFKPVSSLNHTMWADPCPVKLVSTKLKKMKINAYHLMVLMYTCNIYLNVFLFLNYCSITFNCIAPLVERVEEKFLNVNWHKLAIVFNKYLPIKKEKRVFILSCAWMVRMFLKTRDWGKLYVNYTRKYSKVSTYLCKITYVYSDESIIFPVFGIIYILSND